MANLTAFYDYILPDAPGVGMGVAKQEIRNAIIEYCERSLIYEYTVPAIDVVAETSVYALTPEAATRIVDIKEVRHNGVPLDPANEDQLDALFTDWRTTGTGTPDYYMSNVDRSSVQLVLTPGSSLTGGLVVKVAQAPLRSAETVPDWMLERKVTAIGYGAKAKLFAMSKKPWSNPQAAQYYAGLFDAACGRADIERGKSFTRQPLRSTASFK